MDWESTEPSLSFVIRLWREETGVQSGNTIWRGHVTHVPSGDRRYFQALDEVPEIIRPYLERTAAAPNRPAELELVLEMMESPRVNPPGTDQPEQLAGLRSALKRLDALLNEASAAAQSAYGPEAAADRFRGLYVSADEVARLLEREPGEPFLRPTEESGQRRNDEASIAGEAADSAWVIESRPVGQDKDEGVLGFVRRWGRRGGEVPRIPPPTAPPRPAHPPGQPALPIPPRVSAGPQMEWLQRTYQLNEFELDVILLALAPELDRRYERLYAYLQDDVTRRRPGVDLAFNLFCNTIEEKTRRQADLSPEAPLIRHRLIHLIPDRAEPDVPLLAHFLKLDGQIVRFLLLQKTLDPRLATFCRLSVNGGPGDGSSALPEAIHQSLKALVAAAREGDRLLVLYFHGSPGNGRQAAAGALAAETGAPLLVADLPQALAGGMDLLAILPVLLREARFHGSFLYLDGWDAVAGEAHQDTRERLLEGLAQHSGIVMLAGAQPWAPPAQTALGILVVPFPQPDFDRRRDAWDNALAAGNASLRDEELDALAGRFRLTHTQIEAAARTAVEQARWRGVTGGADPSHPPQPTLAELFAAARAQTGHNLAALARKIEPAYRWGDIVLPDDARDQLREMVQRVDRRHRVLGDWGFEHKLALGKGVNALFAGPSGTGKTMAADIIAYELGLDLYKIDLSSIVSKYIGETEKNLDRIFRAARDANAILFFDEADALFGKRSEVRDSHDRYANIEISYLLQKMEEHDGIAILATNLRQNLDDAFVRRLAFTIHFPFPDARSRRLIWEGIWPDTALLADDVDLDFLAQEFHFSGGNIRNVALAAAYLAAESDDDEGVITMADLLQAVRREYQKLGKDLSEADLDRYWTKYISTVGALVA